MFQIKVVDDTEITRDTIYRMPSEPFFRKSVEFHEEWVLYLNDTNQK